MNLQFRITTNHTEPVAPAHVVVEAATEFDARLAIVKRYGIAVAQQGRAFVHGYLGPDTGYSLTKPEAEAYDVWIPVELVPNSLAAH